MNYWIDRGKALRKESKKVELKESPYHPIDAHAINAAAQAGQFSLRMMEETEKRIRSEGLTVRRNSATYTHLLFFQSTSATQKFSRSALLGVETTSEIGKRFRLSSEETGIGLSKFSLRDTIISDSCPAHPSCDREMTESPFRTIDGSCNNLERTAWGKSKTQFQRALLPQYADGKSAKFFNFSLNAEFSLALRYYHLHNKMFWQVKDKNVRFPCWLTGSQKTTTP